MKTLFERIGGKPSVELMVTAFYQRVLADPLLSPFFEQTPVEKLEKMQVSFFTIALGGDEPDKMPSICDAHRGRGIESKHLARFTELLIDTLHEVGVSEADTHEIHQRIATYSNDVLGDSAVDG